MNIHFGADALVHSVRDELSMELRFTVKGLVKGFTYLLVVREEASGTIIQTHDKIVRFDSEQGDAYNAVFVIGIIQDSDAPRRFIVQVTDTFAPSSSLVAQKDRTVPLPGLLEDLASNTMRCRTEVVVGGSSKTAGVTMASVASIDRFLVVLYSVAHWEGAVSLAFYAREERERELLRAFILKVLQPFCGRRMQALSVTLMSECREPGASEVLDFPINALRSAALSSARTDIVLYTDIDFIPSAGAKEIILDYFEADSDRASRDLLVLPCFWTVDGGLSQWPLPVDLAVTLGETGECDVRIEEFSRQRLLAELTDGRVRIPWRPFQSHTATNYSRWLNAQDARGRTHAPYNVEYSSWYEPYFALNISAWRGARKPGIFDERFTFGAGDKAQVSLEAAALGYAFVVHPSIYVVHVPEQLSWRCIQLCLSVNASACIERCTDLEASVRRAHKAFDAKLKKGFTYYHRSALSNLLLDLPHWHSSPLQPAGLQCFPARQAYHALLSKRDVGELMVQFLVHVELALERLAGDLTSDLQAQQKWRIVGANRFVELIPSLLNLESVPDIIAGDFRMILWRACFASQPLQGHVVRTSGYVMLEFDRRLLDGFSPSVAALGPHTLRHELISPSGSFVFLNGSSTSVASNQEGCLHTAILHVKDDDTIWAGKDVFACRLTTYVYLSPRGQSHQDSDTEDFKVDRSLWLFPRASLQCASSSYRWE